MSEHLFSHVRKNCPNISVFAIILQTLRCREIIEIFSFFPKFHANNSYFHFKAYTYLAKNFMSCKYFCKNVSESLHHGQRCIQDNFLEVSGHNLEISKTRGFYLSFYLFNKILFMNELEFSCRPSNYHVEKKG
jgi:hypothetical protein